MFHGSHVQARDEAVVAGDLVALGEFGDGLNLTLHFLQLTGQRANPHDGLELITEAFRVDLHGVTLEHTAFFEATQPFGDTGRGQAAEVCQRLE
ncbi:hypothetical protein D3C84_971140 [compost metagenome]